MMRTVVISVLCIGLLAACNTVKGMGQDVKSAGQAIENSSDNTKEKMR